LAAEPIERTTTLPAAPPHLSILERHVWYADRLRELGVDFDPSSDTDRLASIYRAAYRIPLLDIAEPAADSWAPIDLSELPDKPPVQPTLGDIGIVYPGKRHVFSGPPESAKTLLAYAILIEVVRQGATGILIDFEMGSYDARDRLTELGATTSDIQRIRYLEPDEPATEDRIHQLVDHQAALVVLDAAAGAYQLQNLDDNNRGDVETFNRIYVKPFWRAGTATILIDHVVKNTKDRGKYQIGSERKLGASDVHLGFDTITPISRGGSGHYKITTHKDRGGCLKRGRLADIELESDPLTHHIRCGIRPAEATAPDTQDTGYFRPTHLMEKVSAYLELQQEPVSRNAVVEALGGTKEYVLKAIAALVTERFLLEHEGAQRSRPVSSIRPYRENDPACNPENPESGSVVRSGSESGSRTTVVRWFGSGSTVVREPAPESGSVVRPPYGDDTTRPHGEEPPTNPSGSEPLPAPTERGWFADNGTLIETDLAYYDHLELPDTE
jgi:hypothetical protein